MPIMGLSDRASLDPRFKEIGRIRKGAAKNGNRPGRDLDHFRYVPDSRHQESADVFRRIYGAEPTSIEVHFPFDDTERVFGSWRESYGQNRLCKLRCDGARWHDWIEGDRHHHSTAGRECDLECRDTENRCPDCPLTYVGRLSVILVPMWEAGQIGMITVITSSINDIANLTAKLVQWEPLTGKPFALWRETERIGAPIDGQRKGIDSDLLHLELQEERMNQEFKASVNRSRVRLLAPQPAVRIAAQAGAPPQIDFDGELLEGYEQPTGDELLNGDFRGAPPGPDTREELKEEQEVVPVPEQGRDCVPLSWRELYERALSEMGDFRGYYKTREDVKGAVRSFYSGFAERSDKTTIAQAWGVLWDHIESAEAETA